MKMNSGEYRFSIGSIKGLVVSDGTLVVPPPPSEKKPANGSLPGEKMDVLNLYLETGEHNILIDTGCGQKMAGTDTGHLVERLKAAGIGCEDIDTIIFTHGHLDHVGGTFDRQRKAVFPAARFIVSRLEWQCWLDKKEKRELQPMFNTARRDLLPVQGLFHLAAEGEEILPGIILTTAPGHSPGSAVLRITSQGQTLNVTGDLIHSFIEFSRPDYYSFLDTDPEQSIRSRQSMISQLAATHEAVFACHFPFPGLGYFEENGSDIRWQPI